MRKLLVIISILFLCAGCASQEIELQQEQAKKCNDLGGVYSYAWAGKCDYPPK